VAKRSGDTAFRMSSGFRKRRGASLPAAVQNRQQQHQCALVIRVHPWLRILDPDFQVEGRAMLAE